MIVPLNLGYVIFPKPKPGGGRSTAVDIVFAVLEGKIALKGFQICGGEAIAGGLFIGKGIEQEGALGGKVLAQVVAVSDCFASKSTPSMRNLTLVTLSFGSICISLTPSCTALLIR